MIIFLDLSNNKYIAINFRKEEKEKMKIEEKEKIEKLIRSVEDFPEKGVIFRDITTALKDKEGLEIIIKDFTDRYKNKGIDYVVGADARGFIFGAAIAYNIGAGFVPARKPGKLPAEVESVEYSLEYGKNSIEIHKDAFEKNSKILIVDDLLATGGTAKAMVQLVEKLEAENAALYCSNLTKWDMQNNSFFLLKKDYPQKKYDFLFEGGSAGCTYVFTKNLAQQLKAFIPTVDSSCWEEFSHDWLVYFFARSRGFKVCIDGNSYIHYRLHNNNVHGHLNQLSFSTIKYKIGKVLRGYHKKHIENYIKYIEPGSDYYKIYRAFLGSYFQRNKMILKYNTQLMRDTKKFYLFLLLNLFRFK